ncbi:MAG: septum formation initiator family protein [Lachnospiraceae bacterium]
MKQRKQIRNRRKDRMVIFAIVVLVVGVMTIQIVNLQEKKAEYTARQEALTQQLEEETQRQEDLKEYASYTQTQQYVEEIAKSRLGLVYPNEIIFREKK